MLNQLIVAPISIGDEFDYGAQRRQRCVVVCNLDGVRGCLDVGMECATPCDGSEVMTLGDATRCEAYLIICAAEIAK